MPSVPQSRVVCGCLSCIVRNGAVVGGCGLGLYGLSFTCLVLLRSVLSLRAKDQRCNTFTSTGTLLNQDDLIEELFVLHVVIRILKSKHVAA